MQLAEMQRRDGKRRKGCSPERTSGSWPAARDSHQWDHQRDERVREQPHPKWRGHRR